MIMSSPPNESIASNTLAVDGAEPILRANYPEQSQADQSHPPEKTIISEFRCQVARRGTRTAFWSRTSTWQWESRTWREYGQLVDRFSEVLIGWGVKQGDRVAILSENRFEWHVADIAAMTIGAISVPLYPTSSREQVRFLLEHSGATICLVAGGSHLTTVVEAASDLTTCRSVVKIGRAHV